MAATRALFSFSFSSVSLRVVVSRVRVARGHRVAVVTAVRHGESVCDSAVRVLPLSFLSIAGRAATVAEIYRCGLIGFSV